MKFLKMLLVVACLAIAFPASAQVNDDFNRGDDTSLGANWTDAINGMQVASNVAIDEVDAAYNVSYWSANVFSNDQYAEATIAAATAVYPGVVVRFSNTGGGQGYGFFVDPGTSSYFVQRFAAGIYVADVFSGSASFTVGDVIRLEVSGTTLTAKKNGVTVNSGPDPNVASGSPGVGTFANGIPDPAQRSVDDFEGGDLVGGAGSTRTGRMLRGVGR